MLVNKGKNTQRERDSSRCQAGLNSPGSSLRIIVVPFISFFILCLMPLLSWVKKSLLTSSSQRFSLIFSSRSFLVSVFCLFYDLFQVNSCVWCEVRISFLILVSSDSWLKNDCTFPIELLCHLCHICSVDPFVYLYTNTTLSCLL